MKRFLILFMILGLIAGSVATAEAKKGQKSTRTERTVGGSYGPYPAPVTGCNSPLGKWACMNIQTRATERFFTAKVTDAHGLPVFVEVYGGGVVARFCGETREPVSFPAGSELQFHIGLNNWLVSPDCPAHRVKSTGTISVTLSSAEEGTLRSGSFVSGDGWLFDSDLGGCQMAPDCIAWLESGCRTSLSGREPGFMSSIVDVASLSDGTTERRFQFGAGHPAGLVWGGAQVQFWDFGCEEIREARWHSTDCDEDAGGRNCYSTTFPIPRSATWMTVTGYQDDVNLAWTLR